MCTYPVQPVCTFILHIPGILIFIKSTVDCIAHFSSLHILLLILFYCFYLSSLLSYYYLYLNICSCVMYHLLFLFFLHCPLSGPVLTSISLLIIPCMIVYVTNKREPWTLNLDLKEQYFMTAQPQRLGAEKEEKHINVQMGLYYGSSRYAVQF